MFAYSNNTPEQGVWGREQIIKFKSAALNWFKAGLNWLNWFQNQVPIFDSLELVKRKSGTFLAR